MSLTKTEAAELVQDMLSGGQTPDNYKISIAQIIKACDSALSYLIAKHYLINRADGDDIDGAFVSAFPKNTVYFDKDRFEYFIPMPARMVKLPGGGDKGIKQISGVRGQDAIFIKIPNGAIGVMAPLESSRLLGKIGYYIENEKIFFVDRTRDLEGNQNGKIKGISNVMVKMIASIDGLDDDEPMPLPSDMEVEFLTILQQLFAGEKATPVDDTNDNHSK